MNRIARYLDDLAQVDDEAFAFDGSKFDLATGLHNHQLRHYDPTPGRWLDESPVGYEGDDANVTPYVGRKPE